MQAGVWVMSFLWMGFAILLLNVGPWYMTMQLWQQALVIVAVALVLAVFRTLERMYERENVKKSEEKKNGTNP